MIPRFHRAEIDWREFEHFAGFGWDNDRIARRLGVDPASLRTALARRAARARVELEQNHDAGPGEAA